MKTDNEKIIILKEWENQTQIIEMFSTTGQRNNPLAGFNIEYKYRDAYRGISFTPSYDQIISFGMDKR